MDADKLREYRDKRDPARTPEPVPAQTPVATTESMGGAFVIQEHHARRLHYDVRLERDGVLVSELVGAAVGLAFLGARHLFVQVLPGLTVLATVEVLAAVAALGVALGAVSALFAFRRLRT